MSPSAYGRSFLYFLFFVFSFPNQFFPANQIKMQSQQLSRLMRIHGRFRNAVIPPEAKSLASAWAIFLNEDITVHHLVKKT